MTMTKYEILLMLDPEMPEERQTEIVGRIRELVERGDGTWVAHEPWGRRRLAYEIAKKTDGTYHLLHVDAQPETLDEISRVLKITDGVMRHLPTHRIEGSRLSAPAPLPATPPPSAGGDGYGRSGERSFTPPPIDEAPVGAPPAEPEAAEAAPVAEAPVAEAPVEDVPVEEELTEAGKE